MERGNSVDEGENSEINVKQSDTYPFQDSLEKSITNGLINNYERYPENKRLETPFFVNQLILDKRAFIQRNVAEILREMEERRRLKGAMLLEMEEEIKKADIALTDIEHWGIGYNQGIDLERRAWRDKIFDLRKEMRIETINCFRDVIMLRKELVEFLRQDRSILRMLKTLR